MRAHVCSRLARDVVLADLLRFPGVEGALRHFQMVGPSRQDWLDDLEKHEIGAAAQRRVRQHTLKASIRWREADGVHRDAVLERLPGEQSALPGNHRLFAL